MVDIKEIRKELEKLKDTDEKLKYLNKLLKETKNKKLKEEIDELIKEIGKSLESRLEGAKAVKSETAEVISKSSIALEEAEIIEFKYEERKVATRRGRGSELEGSLDGVNVREDNKTSEYNIKLVDYVKDSLIKYNPSQSEPSVLGAIVSRLRSEGINPKNLGIDSIEEVRKVVGLYTNSEEEARDLTYRLIGKRGAKADKEKKFYFEQEEV